jgi:undecaprenyl pyrophosphate phosphatase UppP
VSGFHVAFIAAAILLGAAWIVVALQVRTRRTHPVEVPRIAAARAIGCAQCAPVAETA